MASNFWLHLGSSFATFDCSETLVRCNLIRFSSLEWQSWPLWPLPSAWTYQLLEDLRVFLHSADWHWLKVCCSVSYIWSTFLRTPMTLVTSEVRILTETTSTFTGNHLLWWPLPPPFILKSWKRVRPPHHLTDTNKIGCWSSFVSLVAKFLQSHSVILDTFLYTRVGFILWSRLETQSHFQVHPPPLASFLAIKHSSLFLPNALPCYVCSLLSTPRVASVY